MLAKAEQDNFISLIASKSIELQSAKNIQEAGDIVYKLICDQFKCDLLIISETNEDSDHNLLFVRTKNDTTITGHIMNLERDISTHLMNNSIQSYQTTLESLPTMHYCGVTHTTNNFAISLSLLRLENEFTEEEIKLATIDLQLFIPIYLNRIISDKNQIIGSHESQNKQQSNFIASITHDLRNPLGCIKGYASTLLRDDVQWDVDTQHKFIEVIDTEADRLGDMITNMLETARLESGQYELNFDQVSISTLMNTLLESNKDRYPDLQISIEMPDQDALIMMDTLKITRAFQNLIDNTVKHANSFEIWIKIIISQSVIHFFFIDKGEGIPQSRWKTVFNKFSRNPDDSPGTHGTGLGLFITRQIILKHGGEIEIDEATTEGTTIRISLPKIPSIAASA